jgi:hypothetical protein
VYLTDAPMSLSVQAKTDTPPQSREGIGAAFMFLTSNLPALSYRQVTACPTTYSLPNFFM